MFFYCMEVLEFGVSVSFELVCFVCVVVWIVVMDVGVVLWSEV